MNKTLGIKWRKQSQMAGDRPPMMSPGVSLRGVSIGYSYVCMYVCIYVRTLLKKTVVYTVTHRKSLTVSNRKIFYGHSP